MIFLTDVSRNKCNTSFRVFLAGKSISSIIFKILCHHQGQNVNFKVK